MIGGYFLWNIWNLSWILKDSKEVGKQKLYSFLFNAIPKISFEVKSGWELANENISIERKDLRWNLNQNDSEYSSIFPRLRETLVLENIISYLETFASN